MISVVDNTNRIIINNKLYLAFNYSKSLYVGNLQNDIEFNELEDFIKSFN